ncbi:preprotein translocase subunit YajC [Butyricicoccus faecihominis]|uniref:preprotein translocase subunit YajC n=1 Tax=Butyricicoccaceae TaxID=3085642 RepID=UPI00247AF436|nr:MULTISPECIES: preprotein translocase subunit YajC [Butyricicoccaceae]MCQ5130347.1 preprotein translocase subunit YajC [Butyricicoccus faecihominis]WNX83857.1 preprotein translocase subunit YajC [Agathobaculum sp. NTUH-O15-33]
MPSGQQYLQAIMQFAPLVLLIVLFYFMLIRPQRKRDKAEKEMRNSIDIGDEISTIGGFIGRVVNIKDDVLIIETSNDRTKLKIYRWAIRGKEAEPTESVEAPKDAK